MNNKPSELEKIKENSNYLRGTINESLLDELTGSIIPEDAQILKFHGSYQQYDRDLESERRKQKLEPLYQFMIRIRAAGGITTMDQWLALDKLADEYANSTLKLTTRQAFQLHGVFKRNLKDTIRKINDAIMTTISACGDVNRNVMCNPNPYHSYVHAEVLEASRQITIHLTPKTTAYHEIWLNKRLVAESHLDDGSEKDKSELSSDQKNASEENKPKSNVDHEPLYGKTYLPRKFKIALAIPPYNDTDIFANDLGFIAIEKDKKLTGYNVVVGGGMGTTLENKNTYPRLGSVIGFIPKDKIVEVSEKVVAIQRDHGNRSDRKVARLKYTIDRLGLDWFRKELNERLGWALQDPKTYKFTRNGDLYGWHKDVHNVWHFTMFVENGRVRDTENIQLKSCLREIAKIHKGDFRLTGNQNLVIGNVSESSKPAINNLLKKYKVLANQKKSGLRLNSLACVALNTCGLAHADAERYLPSLIDKIDAILERNGLMKEDIIIRMTGCPNGCARPYLGEIGFVGRAPGRYNMYLGAGFSGDRLNKLYKEMLNEQEILAELETIISSYANDKDKGERFGDFVIRKGIVTEVREGKQVHQ